MDCKVRIKLIDLINGGLEFLTVGCEISITDDLYAAVTTKARGVHEFEHAIIIKRVLLTLIIPNKIFYRYALGKR